MPRFDQSLPQGLFAWLNCENRLDLLTLLPAQNLVDGDIREDHALVGEKQDHAVFR